MAFANRNYREHLDPRFNAVLKRYSKQTDMNCPYCGYEGKVGYIGWKPKWFADNLRLVWWCLVFGLGFPVSVFFYLTREERFSYHFGRCPNCGTGLIRSGANGDAKALTEEKEFVMKPVETPFEKRYGICEYDFTREFTEEQMAYFLTEGANRFRKVGWLMLRRDATKLNKQRAEKLVAEINASHQVAV